MIILFCHAFDRHTDRKAIARAHSNRVKCALQRHWLYRGHYYR